MIVAYLCIKSGLPKGGEYDFLIRQSNAPESLKLSYGVYKFKIFLSFYEFQFSCIAVAMEENLSEVKNKKNLCVIWWLNWYKMTANHNLDVSSGFVLHFHSHL